MSIQHLSQQHPMMNGPEGESDMDRIWDSLQTASKERTVLVFMFLNTYTYFIIFKLKNVQDSEVGH